MSRRAWTVPREGACFECQVYVADRAGEVEFLGHVLGVSRAAVSRLLGLPVTELRYEIYSLTDARIVARLTSNSEPNPWQSKPIFPHCENSQCRFFNQTAVHHAQS